MQNQKTTQSDKIKQAAHDLETDSDEKWFDEKLGKIAKPKEPNNGEGVGKQKR